MNKPLRLSALTFALIAGAPAFAQDPAQRVEVTGTRYDVRSVCPAIDDDLRAQIARRLSAMPDEARLQVTFHLDGRTVDGVEAHGSTFEARRAVRRSVQQADCDNGSAGRQQVRFVVVYRWKDSVAAPTVVAAAAR